MQETIVWEVVPKREPTVIRNCPKCGRHAVFESSGKFRVNANQSKLDIWLIYQCQKCKETWNMTLFTRIHPRAIDKELYEKFSSNDKSLAKFYAFDTVTHRNNKSCLNDGELMYEIKGASIKLEDLKRPVHISLLCEYPFGIRIDRILSCKLGVSRETVKKLINKELIQCDQEKNLNKAKLSKNILIKIIP